MFFLVSYVTNLSLKDYFDAGKLEVARKQVAANDRVIVVGSGTAMIAQAEATLVYVDMAVGRYNSVFVLTK